MDCISNKSLDEVFEDIVNMARYDNSKKKLQLNKKLLQNIKKYMEDYINNEEQWNTTKQNCMFDYLISKASCERHLFDFISETNLATFYYQLQCALSTVKCNMA